ncbi:MMPL family transporter [Solicola sp. PLA-1-18]|uniref:MMPL family transporter n=1 Tax=Solicola sp. PLA-1-18 TaxID=3380532 RepID=UPI003B7D8F94
MAWYLYRLGRWSFRSRKLVLSLWLALLVLAGAGAATLSGPTSDQFSVPGIESVKAFDLIKERTPQAAPDGATARVVFEAPAGQSVTEGANKAAIDATLKSLESPDATITSPEAGGTISENGRVAYATISYAEQATSLSSAVKSSLEDAPQIGEDAGLRVEVGGDALTELPETGSSEAIGVGLALVILVITFGSLVAAGMPLVTALVGVGIGVAGITTLTGFMDLGSTTPILATMLGLAVGIDYALFIVSRYRHEIRTGREPEDAIGRAVGTAGSAVVFAGLTVIIALLGLSIVGISFLTEMGIAAAATVFVAVLIALTLLPALAGFAGKRILSGRIPGLRGRDPEDGSGKPTAGRRWVDFVTKRKLPVFLVGIVAAGVVAVPALSLQLALPDDGTAPAESSARQAYDLISENFGPGANGPLLAVVDTKGADDPAAAVQDVTDRIGAIKTDIATVVPASPADPSDTEAVQAYEGQLQQAQYAIVTVIPKSGPSDADTQQLVDTIRADVRGVEAQTGAEVLVTGQTAVGVDVSESLQDAFPRYLLVVVGLAFILLMTVFRSILVPLKAVLGFLVTVVVSLGATTAVFQWGWLSGVLGVDNPGPVISLLPLLLTGILFGLAMDYEVFLVSRMREEYVHGRPAQEAVTHGFQYGARVVTAAAAIMVGVFGSFAFSDQAIVKSIGFGLAIGILADAFLVRMTLVPAVMAMIGDKAWWLPRWLDRILPNLDIEGERLLKHLEPEADRDKPDGPPHGPHGTHEATSGAHAR